MLCRLSCALLSRKLSGTNGQRWASGDKIGETNFRLIHPSAAEVPELPERFQSTPHNFKRLYLPDARTVITLPNTWNAFERWEEMEHLRVKLFAFLPHQQAATNVSLTVYDRVTDMMGDVEEPEKALSKMLLQLTVDNLQREWVQAARESDQDAVIIRSLRYWRPAGETVDGEPTAPSIQVEDCIGLKGQNVLLHLLYQAPEAVWEKDEPTLGTIKTNSLFWYDHAKWLSTDQLGGVSFPSLW